MEVVFSVLYQRLAVVLFAAAFGVLVSRIAWSKGFFYLPQDNNNLKNVPTGLTILKAFLIFLFIEMVLAPALYAAWVFYDKGTVVDPAKLGIPVEFKSWANLGIIGLTGFGLIMFFNSLDKVARNAIWGSSSESRGGARNIKDFLMGGLVWIIAYPWILVIGQLLAILIAEFYHGPLPDQAAVKHLKDLYEHPLLFGITGVAVFTIIPFIEELLFRGFLQSWLKANYGRTKAILLTSLIFASFHFSMSQGIENIEFISSLFFLSCFLGFVKERQKSLWASVGLHSTFNAISILMLLSQLK